MQPADRAALEGQPLPAGTTELPAEASEGLEAYLLRFDQGLTADHSECRIFPLDMTDDPDAKAALRHYAARVAATRPVLARDLISLVGDELAPGERYVEVPPELPWERGQ